MVLAQRAKRPEQQLRAHQHASSLSESATALGMRRHLLQLSQATQLVTSTSSLSDTGLVPTSTPGSTAMVPLC